MNEIVRTATKVMFPLIMLFGMYVIVHGHTTPGGTFSGGSVMAGGFVAYTLAHGVRKTELDLKEMAINVLKSLAGFILIFLIVFELFLRSELLPTETLFTLWSGSSLMIFNIVGGIMVFTGLLMVWYTIAKADVE